MLVMSLIALFGLVGVVLVCAIGQSRAASRRAQVQADVEREMGAMVRRAQEIDTAFVDHVLAGGAVDEGVNDYQRERAAVLAGEQPENPWRWGSDRLNSWKIGEQRRRTDDANRKLFLPVFGAGLAIVLICVTAIGIVYQHLEVRPAKAGGVGVPAFPPPISDSGSPTATDVAAPTTPSEGRP